MAGISDIGFSLLESAEVARMRSHPDYRQWGEALSALSNVDSVHPLADVCRKIVATGLASLQPINDFLFHQAAAISTDEYLRASETAEATLTTNVHAAFLLSLVSMMGWSASLGRNPYEHDRRGSPNVGWTRIPYICSLACLRLGDPVGAKTLAEEGYQVLMAAWQAPWPKAQERLDDYKVIFAKSLRKYQAAIDNFADDMRDSCQPHAENFRAEVGAILWTLGSVPESQLFMSTSKTNHVPSRRLFGKIVRDSIGLIPTDNLLQYVWLQLKDRPPFNIRTHDSLFPIINRRYEGWIAFAGCPVNPCESYAKALISLMRGNLTAQQAAEFLKVQEWIQDTLFPHHLNRVDYIRMTCLANVVVLSMGWAKKEVTDYRVNEHWHALVDMAREMRLAYVLHPEWPEIFSRADISLFQVIESAFEKPLSDSLERKSQCENVLGTLESVRSAALDYWLKIALPRLGRDEDTDEMYELRRREGELLQELRGAVFQTLVPILPVHYHHVYVSGMGVPAMRAISGSSPPQITAPSQKNIDPNEGRQEYLKLAGELTTLYSQMKKYAPLYCKKRLNPTATVADLVNAMNAHLVRYEPLERPNHGLRRWFLIALRKLWCRAPNASLS